MAIANDDGPLTRYLIRVTFSEEMKGGKPADHRSASPVYAEVWSADQGSAEKEAIKIHRARCFHRWKFATVTEVRVMPHPASVTSH